MRPQERYVSAQRWLVCLAKCTNLARRATRSSEASTPSTGMAEIKITAASKALSGRRRNRHPCARSRASSSSTKNATIASWTVSKTRSCPSTVRPAYVSARGRRRPTARRRPHDSAQMARQTVSAGVPGNGCHTAMVVVGLAENPYDTTVFDGRKSLRATMFAQTKRCLAGRKAYGMAPPRLRTAHVEIR
jgi:hypothetical protein